MWRCWQVFVTHVTPIRPHGSALCAMLYVMATTTPKDKVRIIVDVRPSKFSDNGRLEAVAYFILVNEEGKIRNCSWGYGSSLGDDYADLRIEGWVARDFDKKDDFYFGLGYHNALEYREVFTVDERRAASMAKTLRRLNNKRGYPQDYAQFLAYVAEALGIKGQAVFARRVENSGRGWSYDDSEYRWMDINALRSYFQDALRKWRGDSD